MTIDDLLEINNKKLNEAKKIGDEKKSMLYEKLAKLFQDQPEIFFKTDMESSLKILIQLLPEEQVKEAYTSLISPENFEKLRRKFKLWGQRDSVYVHRVSLISTKRLNKICKGQTLSLPLNILKTHYIFLFIIQSISFI